MQFDTRTLRRQSMSRAVAISLDEELVKLQIVDAELSGEKGFGIAEGVRWPPAAS